MSARLDRNGYADSIMLTVSGECYICLRHTETARHEIYFGTSNRKNSKKHGLWVNLCPECHNRVHRDRITDLWLKEMGQRRYEMTHTRQEFIEIFGRSYK